MEFAVDHLPAGLKVDPQTGQISGSVAERGEYVVTFHAKNALGEAQRKFKIVCGDTLALTPYMGWDSWYFWETHLSDRIMRDAADAMVANGMINHGYSYVNADGYWQMKPGSGDPMINGPPRDARGNINPSKWFPDMKGLTDYIHGRGLKAGIYTSPGRLDCLGRVGAYQHEEQDARRFAAWGFDFLKYDWCEYCRIVPHPDLAAWKEPYRKMGDILKRLDRDIIYNVCQYGLADVWQWGREVGGHSWRTGCDFGGVYREIPRESCATSSIFTAAMSCSSSPGPAAGTIPTTSC